MSLNFKSVIKNSENRIKLLSIDRILRREGIEGNEPIERLYNLMDFLYDNPNTTDEDIESRIPSDLKPYLYDLQLWYMYQLKKFKLYMEYRDQGGWI